MMMMMMILMMMQQISVKKRIRLDWVGKVIHQESCKKFQWDFEILTDHLLSARQPDSVNKKKKRKKLPNSELCRPDRPQNNIKRK